MTGVPAIPVWSGQRRVLPPASVPHLRLAGTVCIITCHNYGRYLEKCIQSCLHQTLKFDHILVVDDASTDETATVAAKFASVGVRYLKVDVHHQCKTRRAGVEAVPLSAFLLFVDADDWLTPEYHLRLRRAITTNRIGVAYGSLTRIDEEDKVIGPHPAIRPFSRTQLRKANMINMCSLIRREAYDQAGGMGMLDEVSPLLVDWDLWKRIDRLGWGFSYTPQAVLMYREHDQQLSQRRRENLWDGCLPTLKECTTVSVVTLFAGRYWALEHYLRWIKALDWKRENLHLIAVDNSGDPTFARALQSVLQDTGVSYSFVPDVKRAVTTLPATSLANIVKERVSHGYEMNAHLARLYARARQYIPPSTDFVWTVEDDVEPPSTALNILVFELFKSSRIGALSGVLKSRFTANQIMLMLDGRHLPCPEPGQLVRVSNSGFYCALFRREVFDDLAFRPSKDWDRNYRTYYDWAAWEDIKRSGWETMATGDVLCKHWLENGTCLVCP